MTGSLQSLECDFTVVFHQQQIGLQLETDFFNQHVVIAKVNDRTPSKDKNEKSSIQDHRLEIGLILCVVNKENVLGLTFSETLEKINQCKRPIELGFKYPHKYSPTKLRRKLSVIKKVIPYVIDGKFPLWKYIHADENGGGIVLQRKTEIEVYNNSDTIKQVTINKGSRLMAIDDLSVEEMSLNEIILKLKEEQTTRRICIQPTSRSPLKRTSSTSRKNFSTIGKRLSRAFKRSDEASRKVEQVIEKFDVKPPDSTCLIDYSDITISLSNLEWGFQQVKSLVDEERIVAAGALLEQVLSIIQKESNGGNHHPSINIVKSEILDNVSKYEGLRDRNVLATNSIVEFNSTEQSGWKFAQTYFGISTYWKPGDNGTIWMKLDGMCEDVDVFDAIAVIRETGLYNKWAPFCNKADMLKLLTPVELVTYLNVNIPLMQRDAVVHAFGIDATYEYGSVVLLGNSVESWEGVEFPPLPGWNGDRMYINAFRALIEPTSRRSARACIIANVDPKTPVPQSLLNFAIKKMAGVLLYLLIKEAKKIQLDPENNEYARRLLEDESGFYAWIRPRVESFFEKLENNTLPKRRNLVSIEKHQTIEEILVHESIKKNLLSNESFGCLLDYTKIVLSMENLEWAYQQIFYLLNEERIFSAGYLYENLKLFLDEKSKERHIPSILSKIEGLVKESEETLNQLRERYQSANKAMHDFNHDEAAGWIYAQTYFGIATHWKPGKNGTIWLKVSGICDDVDILDAVSVIRETDLFYKWAPFCNKSELLANLSRGEIITYFNTCLPFVQRDAVLHAYGIDATYEHGCVLLLGNSIEKWDGIEFPPISGWNANRMEVHSFRALIEPLSKRSAKTSVVANIDPKAPIPQTLLNFIVKKLAGVLLYYLIKEAGKIQLEPQTNIYAKRIREDSTKFYEWIKPRIQRYFEHFDNQSLPPKLELTPITLSIENDKNEVSDIETKTKFQRSITDYGYDFVLWPFILLGFYFILDTLLLYSSSNWLYQGRFLSYCIVKLIITFLIWWFGTTSILSPTERNDLQISKSLSSSLNRFREIRRIGSYIILCMDILVSMCVWTWTWTWSITETVSKTIGKDSLNIQEEECFEYQRYLLFMCNVIFASIAFIVLILHKGYI